MHYKFYDIESLPNVFTMAVFDQIENSLVVYVLDDDNLAFMPGQPGVAQPRFAQIVVQAIYAANSNFHGSISIKDLRSEIVAEEMARLFGCFAQGSETELPWRLKPDTDPTFDIDNDYLLAGYNSYNYDTTMLALYFNEAWRTWTRVTDVIRDPRNGAVLRTDISWQHPDTGDIVEGDRMPKAAFDPTLKASVLRVHNDNLFTEDFKGSMPSYLTTEFDHMSHSGYVHKDWNRRENRIRQGMLKSGRYVDIGRLNEKQAKVGLKRLLGLIGCQILEADLQGAPQTTEDLVNLIAYNVSDVVNLAELAGHWLYKNQAATKANMLETYPELVYEFQDGKPTRNADGKMKVNRHRVRRNRLFRDSSSQQLSSRTLCPEGHLHDKETVSLTYPCPEKAEQAGIEPFDVLEMIREFHETKVLPRVPDDDKQAVQEAFTRMYDAYSSVRGSNFDSGPDYAEMYGYEGRDVEFKNLKDTPTTCLDYIGPDGKPTGCYVSFSTGGIHGAEYNQALYEDDLRKYREAKELLDFVQARFGATDEGAVALRNSVTKGSAPIELEFPDGEEHFVKDFLKSGFTKTRAKWKELRKPQLFRTSPKGNMTLDKRYVFTSAGLMNHEDFKSYYPGLLRQMGAFENPTLGYDRYGEIFEDKERLGKVMKDKSRSVKEREDAKAQRENVKLILNSASGGGDASFDTPILMNNNIIAMRLIGQMFTWYIGQAQSLEGARVPSTNTDGLYTDLEETLNNAILARESARINVPIDPEPIWLISKDANNRIEFSVKDDGSVKIESAAGDLACWRGPDPSKSLDHPAVIDKVLVDYLVDIVRNGDQDALFEAFDDELGLKYLQQELTSGDLTHRLLMFQNVIASSPSSMQYIFADDEDAPKMLQHYNRVFMMQKDYTPPQASQLPRPCVLAIAAGAVITPAVKASRAKNGIRSQKNDSKALALLEQQGIDARMLKAVGREATIKKLPNIDPDCPMLVVNQSLIDMTPAIAENILANLDLNRYLAQVRKSYEDNWRNAKPKGD